MYLVPEELLNGTNPSHDNASFDNERKESSTSTETNSEIGQLVWPKDNSSSSTSINSMRSSKDLMKVPPVFEKPSTFSNSIQNTDSKEGVHVPLMKQSVGCLDMKAEQCSLNNTQLCTKAEVSSENMEMGQGIHRFEPFRTGIETPKNELASSKSKTNCTNLMSSAVTEHSTGPLEILDKKIMADAGTPLSSVQFLPKVFAQTKAICDQFSVVHETRSGSFTNVHIRESIETEYVKNGNSTISSKKVIEGSNDDTKVSIVSSQTQKGEDELIGNENSKDVREDTKERNL